MRKSRREMAIEGCKAKPKTSGDMETGREGSPSKGFEMCRWQEEEMCVGCAVMWRTVGIPGKL